MPLHFVNAADAAMAKQRTRKVKAGQWVKVCKGVYADKDSEPLERLVKSQIIPIAKHLRPNGVISHRSAVKLAVEDSRFFITGDTNSRLTLPGVTLIEIKGPDADPELDTKVIGMACSGEPRQLMENLQIDRGTGKSLGQRWAEERLELLSGNYGEEHLSTLRDAARTLASKWSWQREFDLLNSLIGALLGTRKANLLSDKAKARARSEPFDADRIELFEGLTIFLNRCDFRQRSPLSGTPEAFSNSAFWDAYFSNYIEGTRFDIDEAEQIVFERRVVHERLEDSHNIMRSYDILSNPTELGKPYADAEEWIALIRHYHRYFMAESPEKLPGEFKQRNNVAGNTHFVDWQRVEGTLQRAYPYLEEMRCAVKRALYAMFVVAEVHPFADGNGRVARKLMNAELFKGQLERIIIPTFYREDYLNGLRAVSRDRRFSVYCRMMDRAQYFTSHFDYSDFDAVKTELVRIRANDDSSDALMPGYNYRREASSVPNT